MRIQEKNYAIRHDEVSIKNHEKLYLETVEILNELEKRFKNPENLKSLAQIKEKLGDIPLTLHGGSGISPDQVKSAINLGVVKININTDLRLRFIESLRHQLTIQSGEKIYEYLTPVIADLRDLVKQKLINFTQNV